MRVYERLQRVETASPWQQSEGHMEVVKVWPEESVAASDCGLAPAANDLIAADESIQAEMEQNKEQGRTQA